MLYEGLVQIEAADSDGATRLSDLIRLYVQIMTQKFGMCLVRLDERELSAKERTRIRERRRAVTRKFEEFLHAGISDGSLAECNVRLTVFAMAGALNWISFWYKPDGEASAPELAEFFVSHLVRTRPKPRDNLAA